LGHKHLRRSRPARLVVSLYPIRVYVDSCSLCCRYLYSSSDAKSLIYSLHRCFCCSVVHLSRTICERRSSCCSVSVSMFLIFFPSLIQIRFHRSNTLVHGIRHESTKRNQAEKYSPIIHCQHPSPLSYVAILPSMPNAVNLTILLGWGQLIVTAIPEVATLGHHDPHVSLIVVIGNNLSSNPLVESTQHNTITNLVHQSLSLSFCYHYTDIIVICQYPASRNLPYNVVRLS